MELGAYGFEYRIHNFGTIKWQVGMNGKHGERMGNTLFMYWGYDGEHNNKFYSMDKWNMATSKELEGNYKWNLSLPLKKMCTMLW